MAAMTEPEVVGGIRVWRSELNLYVGYERRGIEIGHIQLRQEAARALVRAAVDSLPDLNGDRDIVETITELLTAMGEVLAGDGKDGQVIPLTGSGQSALDSLFEAPS